MDRLSVRGLVGDIDRFAVHDGPGIRTAVYLKGCQLRCAWCHSPETQAFAPELLYLAQKCSACGLCLDICPQHAIQPVEAQPPAADGLPQALSCQVAIDWAKCTQCGECTRVCYPGALKMSGTWISAGELVAEIVKDRDFFAASGGGMTLTGGEATAQPAFARQLLQGCKELGIHTALETNGCAPWRVFQELLEWVDLFLYDIKHMDDARHRALTGSSNQLALSNLNALAQRGARVIVRVPCIPGMNDDAENIAATAAYVRQAGLQTIHLLPYNVSAGAKYQWMGREYHLRDQAAQSSERMESLAGICRSYGLQVQIGG